MRNHRMGIRKLGDRRKSICRLGIRKLRISIMQDGRLWDQTIREPESRNPKMLEQGSYQG